MYLYNSLSHKKELFTPNAPDEVKMYTCGPTEKSASRPGERVETACLQSKAQGGKDSWSSPRALEPGPGSPGISGRSRGTWDMGPSQPGLLVDSAGPQPRAQFARDAGRNRVPSEEGQSGKDRW